MAHVSCLQENVDKRRDGEESKKKRNTRKENKKKAEQIAWWPFASCFQSRFAVTSNRCSYSVEMFSQTTCIIIGASLRFELKDMEYTHQEQGKECIYVLIRTDLYTVINLSTTQISWILALDFCRCPERLIIGRHVWHLLS